VHPVPSVRTSTRRPGPGRRDVVRGGVRPGVPRPQQHRQRLPGTLAPVVHERPQRVKPIALLNVGAAHCLSNSHRFASRCARCCLPRPCPGFTGRCARVGRGRRCRRGSAPGAASRIPVRPRRVSGRGVGDQLREHRHGQLQLDHCRRLSSRDQLGEVLIGQRSDLRCGGHDCSFRRDLVTRQFARSGHSRVRSSRHDARSGLGCVLTHSGPTAVSGRAADALSRWFSVWALGAFGRFVRSV
jgi:hypothetical protein